MSQHPTSQELKGLVAGKLSHILARRVALHLLEGCERCGGIVAAAEEGAAELDTPHAASASTGDRVVPGRGAAATRGSSAHGKGRWFDMLRSVGLSGVTCLP
ncbi:MAG: hypothetical protein M3O15_08510, partial [Acidobacteriota bacterium]|nr:hypothetical protein [Acidobacteriota bacterium]